MKLETWLRMAGIPYEVAAFDLAASPKGKVPYIEDEGTLIGDSTLIIEHLTTKYGRDVDEGLSSAERAVSLAFRRLLKENSYWVITQTRYADEANWSIYREMIMQLLVPNHPREIQEQAADGFRSLILGQFKGHGLGRHSRDEVYRIGIADLKAVADYLGDKPFFMGEKPTLADATVYGYVANLIAVPMESPVKQYGLSRPNLTEHLKRMQNRFFP
jgi:glutathione S-transferase